MNWKKIGIVTATLIAVAAMFWFSPYWAVSGLAVAARDNDYDLILEYVDIDVLREDLQSQFREKQRAEVEKGEKTRSDIFAESFLLDRLIDRFVTPRGAAETLRSTLQDLSAPRISMAVSLMTNEAAGWDSINTFRMESGGKMFLVWRWEAFRWRLSGIRFR